MNSEHLITPATLMTASRPIIAAEIGRGLIKGETGVTPLVIAMSATDMEGKVAGIIDDISPNSGYGRTEFGKKLDPIADMLAFVEVASCALASPRMSKLGKTAVSILLASESVKGLWATRANIRHKKRTGEQLVINPSLTGKGATAVKYSALTAAVKTHDLEPGIKRTRYGIFAVVAAATGAFFGEKARSGYKRYIDA